MKSVRTKNKVKKVEYVFSNSRNPELQKVVQLSCDCNAENPCLTNTEVETILRQNAFNLDALNPQYAGMLGAGRLDAAAADQLAGGYSSLSILSQVDNLGCTPDDGRIEIQNALIDSTRTYTYQ